MFLLAVPMMALLLGWGWGCPSRILRQEGWIIAGCRRTVLAVIYGLKQIAQTCWMVAGALCRAGLLVGVAFIRRHIASRPANRVFSPSPLPVLTDFSIFVIAGIFLFIAQYLQLVLGLSPLVAGLWTLPSAAGLSPVHAGLRWPRAGSARRW